MGLTEIRLLKQQALLPKTKKPYYIPKVSAKKAAKMKEQKENGSDSELDLFFNAMRKKCKGKCLFCNAPTTVKNEELWRIAIAHLLPKSKFKSVATNENNWIELCWDCHTRFDNGIISWDLIMDSKERDVVREKLFEVMPLIYPEERKNKLYSKIESLLYRI